jgi:hypothetical protein
MEFTWLERLCAALTSIGLISITHAQAPAEAPARQIEFGRVLSAIEIDGHLDESSWTAAPSTDNFFEVFPGNIEPPSVRTDARFLFDARNIYIGIRAGDPDPQAIRASLVRRDQVKSDQDYIEILLDPLNARHSALLFRVNAHGVVTDGVYDDQRQTRDYAPDLNFDVKTRIDSGGWTIELRIPLATLRYQLNPEQSWAFVIYRNLPRQNSVTLASAPIPRGANCVLCFAKEISDVSLSTTRDPVYVTPHIRSSHFDSDARSPSKQTHGGVDVKWQASSDTVVDVTLAPDFSQIEADDLQLTVNTPFPPSVVEKRPFFLEGADLLSSPLDVIYTRSLTDPDYGARITRRGEKQEYTGLFLHDAGGGIMLEPGPAFAQSALQDFESDAFVGRYKRHLNTLTLGTLATARFNDEGSRNAVYGADGSWSFSTSDRVTAQLLRSHTQNPNRPDLLAAWTGQQLSGTAGTLIWLHSQDAWSTNFSYRSYSHDFRAWNGFISQVGVSDLWFSSELYFYPRTPAVTRIVPKLAANSIRESGGSIVSRFFSPSLTLEGAHDTMLSFNWYPNAEDATTIGPRSYDSYNIVLVTTPAKWMPQAEVSFSAGENVFRSTGEVGDGLSVTATIPLRLFSRFELGTSLGYTYLNSQRPDANPKRLYTQRNTQLNAIWHFSSRAYTQALFQHSTFQSADSPAEFSSRLFSFLVSYQTNWQTRYYIGFHRSSPDPTQSEVFAKLSYVFAR